MKLSKKYELADLFCGAGGTSTGAIEALNSLGHEVRLTAVNHWPVAIATHTANHPESRHLCTGINDVNPRTLYKPNQLDVLWASPECTHHSVARGGKPVSDQSRATAWCVIRWAEALLPKIILVENVPEFLSWGPIGTNGRPMKSKRGATFRAWIATLESLGYKVDHRILCAADYGDPTTRKRLFVQAVRGHRQIVWPDATHAAPGKESDMFRALRPWKTARDVIDWKKPGTSIFTRKRPLAPKTLKRIEAGLRKFGITPHLVAMEHGGRIRGIDRPLPTVTTAKGGAIGVAEPFLIEMRGTSERQLRQTARSIDEPLGTITAGGRHHALAEPFLIHTAHSGERRTLDLSDPLPTVAGNRGDVALVEPFLIQYYGTGGASSVDDPLATVTTKGRHALIRPQVIYNGTRYELDIRFRMLNPRELASAQGFREDYVFTGTKTDQVKQIGNAVPRRLARAIVAAVLSQSSDVSFIADGEALEVAA